jgi:two-component system cell cycle response regulator DivK
MRRAHILVIEDDAASLELTRYLLAAAGHEVIAAGDGRSGLQLALNSAPQLIICDLQIPYLDGCGVARTLRDNLQWHRVPLIALTALSMPGDRDTALAAGFDAYMTKPIDPQAFVGQIEEFLTARPSALAGQPTRAT